MEASLTPPEYVEIVIPAATEERQAPLANFVNVDGSGGVLTLDFFFVPHSKVNRIREGEITGAGVRQEGHTAYLEVEPVSRTMLPLSTATELVVDLCEAIAQKIPELQEILGEFGQKMQEIGLRANRPLSIRAEEPTRDVR